MGNSLVGDLSLYLVYIAIPELVFLNVLELSIPGDKDIFSVDLIYALIGLNNNIKWTLLWLRVFSVHHAYAMVLKYYGFTH